MKDKDYINAVNNMNISEECKNKLLRKIRNSNKKESFIMIKKKIILAAAAAVMIIGAAAYAASSGLVTGWFSGSGSIPDYTQLPTKIECLKDVGYEPILIDSFENGYVFKDGNTVDNKRTDESGNSVEKFKSFSFTYEKDGDLVYFDQSRYTSESAPSEHRHKEESVLTENGVDIYYYADNYKFVPPGYELTDEDKLSEENGDLVISYGSEKVEYSSMTYVGWQVGDMHYGLMQMNGKLSKDDLILMAKEAVNYKNN